MITVDRVVKSYDAQDPPVLDGLSFAISRGDTMSIIGPSGCGKTTLLYILGGLLKPTSGSVAIDGEEVCKPRKKTAIIFQDFGLLPWKTVWDNVCLGLKINKVSNSVQNDVVSSLLADLGLSQYRNQYPVQISGGEKQRVAIARSLAVAPDLLLMDEPFSSLDAMTRERLQDTILSKWLERKFTYLIVTHSVEEAVFLGQHIMVLSSRPAAAKKIIHNPGFGMYDHRVHDDYFKVIKEVRQIVEE
ncbi:MAG: ABC transporter ATP-binding protein [Chloroflexota bacterium]|nr:ABC transporter ATP-binding protein [Chloroflexota bacterium]